MIYIAGNDRMEQTVGKKTPQYTQSNRRTKRQKRQPKKMKEQFFTLFLIF